MDQDVLKKFLENLSPQVLPQDQTQNLNPVPLRSDYVPSNDPPVATSVMRMPKAVPTANDSQPDSTPTDSTAPSVKDYLMKKYGFGPGTSDDDIKAAQSQAADQRMTANLAQAGATIGAALGGTKADNSFYDNMRAQAGQGVADIQMQRAAQQQGLQNEMGISSAAQKMDMDDPNSAQSKSLQAMVQKLYPGKFSDADISKIPASMADSIYKPLEISAKLEELKSVAQTRNDTMRQNAEDRRNLAADKTFTEMSNKILTPRGNTNVQQAQVGLTSGNKAMSIINRYGNNLDNMSEQDYKTLLMEIGKIATGGVPSQHEIAGMSGDTFASKFQGAMSKLGNTPTGAQLGDFIRNNKQYLQELHEVNQKVVADYKTGVYNGYKNRLTPDQKEQFKSENPELFPTQQQSGGQPQGNGQTQSVASDQQKPSWAK